MWHFGENTLWENCYCEKTFIVRKTIHLLWEKQYISWAAEDKHDIHNALCDEQVAALYEKRLKTMKHQKSNSNYVIRTRDVMRAREKNEKHNLYI